MQLVWNCIFLRKNMLPKGVAAAGQARAIDARYAAPPYCLHHKSRWPAKAMKHPLKKRRCWRARSGSTHDAVAQTLGIVPITQISSANRTCLAARAIDERYAAPPCCLHHKSRWPAKAMKHPLKKRRCWHARSGSTHDAVAQTLGIVPITQISSANRTCLAARAIDARYAAPPCCLHHKSRWPAKAMKHPLKKRRCWHARSGSTHDAVAQTLGIVPITQISSANRTCLAARAIDARYAAPPCCLHHKSRWPAKAMKHPLKKRRCWRARSGSMHDAVAQTLGIVPVPLRTYCFTEISASHGCAKTTQAFIYWAGIYSIAESLMLDQNCAWRCEVGSHKIHPADCSSSVSGGPLCSKPCTS